MIRLLESLFKKRLDKPETVEFRVKFNEVHSIETELHDVKRFVVQYFDICEPSLKQLTDKQVDELCANMGSNIAHALKKTLRGNGK